MTGGALAVVSLALLGLAADHVGRLRRSLHLFQLEHYEPARLLGWLRRRPALLRPAGLLAVGGLLAAAAPALAAGQGVAAGVLVGAAGLAAAAEGAAAWRQAEKTPLVFTGRARRLFAAALAPLGALLVVWAALLATGASSAAAVGVLAAGLALVGLAPLVTVAADAALRPVQARINRGYVRRAEQRLQTIAPLSVGITGSYGKTTTKFCVGEVLGADRETLVTPASYNTFLGVTRTINELLEPRHRALVVEMGAYREGDIAELCRLTRPAIGILTSIGPMHLERFGTIEAIKRAKSEIVTGLAPGGQLVTNGDDPECRSIAAAAAVPVTLFGIEAADARVRASDVQLSGGTTSFTLHLDERTYPVEARLLGRHNVRNLLAAAACGLLAGVPDERIVAALQSVAAPPHRLAPIVNAQTGVTVIDDAYNSNPEGAANALHVLAEHAANKRVLVTPGMVELGEVEEAANREFGRIAAGVCDYVILVGQTQTQPVRRGLLDGGFDAERIVATHDLVEATSALGRILTRGDVVLFENDLPDTYAESVRRR